MRELAKHILAKAVSTLETRRETHSKVESDMHNTGQEELLSAIDELRQAGMIIQLGAVRNGGCEIFVTNYGSEYAFTVLRELVCTYKRSTTREFSNR